MGLVIFMLNAIRECVNKPRRHQSTRRRFIAAASIASPCQTSRVGWPGDLTTGQIAPRASQAQPIPSHQLYEVDRAGPKRDFGPGVPAKRHLERNPRPAEGGGEEGGLALPDA